MGLGSTFSDPAAPGAVEAGRGGSVRLASGPVGLRTPESGELTRGAGIEGPGAAMGGGVGAPVKDPPSAAGVD